ncbi:MAG: hypothetical protein HY228_02890 [Candidatus Yonathbacteria bacterium]|nr:hypothetical protein [Candidatus Yonathbacteria bacterium]
MYSIILTSHIIGAVIFFGASLTTFFSYIRPYSVETYRRLAPGVSALLFGEFASGTLLTAITYKPIDYFNLCGFIALYTFIALATFFVLRRRLRDAEKTLPSFVYTFSFAGIIALLFAFI